MYLNIHIHLGTSFDTSGSILVSQGIFSGQGTVSFNDLGDVFTSQILHITSNINLIMILSIQLMVKTNIILYH